jgi:peptidoglycan/LPS O-acetylase OafA/YrhL
LKLKNNNSADFQRHLSALDGFRACLALWVYLGHLAYAVGFNNRLLSMHPLAVDLFMILSGFLMVRTWKSADKTGLSATKSGVSFYIGRFFRIAPLYYFLLIVSALILTRFAAMHDIILKTFPPPWITAGVDYAPHTVWTFTSFKWLILHASFLFGVVPGMEASTPLPDWSLSLEMQFYLIFPFLLILFRKLPWLLLALIASVIAFLAPRLFGNYLDAGIFSHFGQPSLLAYRLNAFFAGMIAAYWLVERDAGIVQSLKRNLYYGLVAAICVVPLTKLVILAYVLFILLAMGNLTFLNGIFSIRPLRYLGEISYSIYLCHILILTPIVYWLINTESFVAYTPVVRFLIAVAIISPLVIAVSSALYKFIEKPPVKFGKFLIHKVNASAA